MDRETGAGPLVEHLHSEKGKLADGVNCMGRDLGAGDRAREQVALERKKGTFRGLEGKPWSS